MTNNGAILLLAACKPLVERTSGAFPSGLPLNYSLNPQDLALLQDFARVQNDQVSAGPGLLKRLFTQAELTPVEVYKLEQLKRLIFKRRYLGQNVVNGSKLGSR